MYICIYFVRALERQEEEDYALLMREYNDDYDDQYDDAVVASCVTRDGDVEGDISCVPTVTNLSAREKRKIEKEKRKSAGGNKVSDEPKIDWEIRMREMKRFFFNNFFFKKINNIELIFLCM